MYQRLYSYLQLVPVIDKENMSMRYLTTVSADGRLMFLKLRMIKMLMIGWCNWSLLKMKEVI